MSDAAAAGGIPIVYVNREPINVDSLPDNQAFVASDERESGTLETKEVCRLFKEAGKDRGQRLRDHGRASNQAAQQRTQDILDVIGGRGLRREGQHHRQADLELDAGRGAEPDDQLALDRRRVRRRDRQQRRERHRRDPGDQGLRHGREALVIGGVDATQDALQAMQAGDLDVTVFQDAAGQGKGSLDAALALAKGDAVEQKVYIPFQLVTPPTCRPSRLGTDGDSGFAPPACRGRRPARQAPDGFRRSSDRAESPTPPPRRSPATAGTRRAGRRRR